MNWKVGLDLIFIGMSLLAWFDFVSRYHRERKFHFYPSTIVFMVALPIFVKVLFEHAGWI